MNNSKIKHIISIMNLANGGSDVVSTNLKMTCRRHAVARGRAAARSTSYSCIAIQCTTTSWCSIVAFVLLLKLIVYTMKNTKIDIHSILEYQLWYPYNLNIMWSVIWIKQISCILSPISHIVLPLMCNIKTKRMISILNHANNGADVVLRRTDRGAAGYGCSACASLTTGSSLTGK